MHVPNETARELWGIRAFAEAHSISTRKVYLLLEGGDLTGVRIGARTLITEASRVEWLGSLKPKISAPLNFRRTASSRMVG
jgi:hypothetical protein